MPESDRQFLFGVVGATSTLFQDAAGTTAVSAVGQPVGRVVDLSGRGNNATQSTSTARPTLVDASGLALNLDGLDDSLATNFAAGTFGSAMDAWVVCSLAEGETTAVLVDDPTSAGVRYFATLDAGVSGSTQRQDGAATANASFSVNGQLAGNVANPSRGALYSAVAGAGISIVQATNLNLSAWQGVKIGTYASSGSDYGFRGRHFALLICPAQPDAIRTKIRKALAKQFGIQGVV